MWAYFFWIKKRNIVAEFARISETVVGVAIGGKKVGRNVISRSFPRSVGIAAWPAQRRFAYRGKFQNLYNERGEIIGKLKLVFLTSFPRNQKSHRLAIIIYDIPSINPPRKLMEEFCFEF